MDTPTPQRYHLAEDRIHIGERTLSAAQYRWLFTDLAENLPDGDRAALQHFDKAGRHELTARRRVMPEQRMLELELQQLSPAAPDAEKSSNFAFRTGTTDTLDIYFSYPLPADIFAPPIVDTRGANARLLVKETTHSYWQRGVPGVSTSIEETALWLERVIDFVQPSRVRVLGTSAGGYAALVFGQLISADAVVSVSPEVVLGKPAYRSRKWFPNGVYNPAYQDVTATVHGLGERLILVYPAYDPMEYEMIRLCREQHPANIVYVPTFHPGLCCVDVGAFARSGSAMPEIPRIVVQQHDFVYDDAAIATATRAYELTMGRDFAASLPLLRELVAIDPANHGFLAHIAYQEALLGDRDQALATLRKALDGIDATLRHPEIREATCRLSRPFVRYYYDVDRRTIATLERLWDEAAGAAG